MSGDAAAINPVLTRWDALWASRPTDAAIIGEDGTVLRSFAAIEEESLRWVDRLNRFPSQSVVGLQIGNGPEWPAILLAVWRCGCVLLPLDFDLSGERRDRAEHLTGAKVRLERSDGEIVIRTLESGSEIRAEADLLKLTSGTTAAPKAVRFGAGQLLADCDSVCRTMGLSEQDRNYGAIAFSHSYGFSNLITPLVCCGVPLVAARDLIPRALADGMARSRATVFPGVPALFRALSAIRPEGSALRLAISAGAPLASTIARNFHQQWGVKVHSFYGASECGGICYDADEDPDVPEGFVGGALQGVEILHPGSPEAARVRVRSGAVGQGYLSEHADDLLGTNGFEPADLLRRERDGYVIAGRVSDAINVAGRKVNPFDIERVVRTYPHVEECVVFGISGGARGEDVAACVVGAAAEIDLRAHCAHRLPAWQVPKHWFFVETLPVSARGKLSRSELQQRYSVR